MTMLSERLSAECRDRSVPRSFYKAQRYYAGVPASAYSDTPPEGRDWDAGPLNLTAIADPDLDPRADSDFPDLRLRLYTTDESEPNPDVDALVIAESGIDVHTESESE